MASERFASTMKSLASLTSQFSNLNSFSKEDIKKATLDILPPAGLGKPHLTYTPSGVCGVLPSKSRTAVVLINKNDEQSWESLLRTVSPDVVMMLQATFQRDTGLTISAIFGEDYWETYRSAFIKKPEDPTQEAIVRLCFASVAGDIAYWRLTGMLFADAMDDAETDLLRCLYAKKGQIAFHQAEMSENLFKNIFRGAKVSVSVVLNETATGMD